MKCLKLYVVASPNHHICCSVKICMIIDYVELRSDSSQQSERSSEGKAEGLELKQNTELLRGGTT